MERLAMLIYAPGFICLAISGYFLFLRDKLVTLGCPAVFPITFTDIAIITNIAIVFILLGIVIWIFGFLNYIQKDDGKPGWEICSKIDKIFGEKKPMSIW